MPLTNGKINKTIDCTGQSSYDFIGEQTIYEHGKFKIQETYFMVRNGFTVIRQPISKRII